MAILKDNRKYQAMTEEEGDQLFMRLGHAKALKDKVEAAWKKKIADLTLRQDEELAPLIANYNELLEELTAYLTANESRFANPRFRKVPHVGKYGFRNVPAKADVTDDEAFIGYALENGYEDLFRVKRTPDKAAALARLKAGEKIPGAKLVPASTAAEFSFEKGWAEQLEGLK